MRPESTHAGHRVSWPALTALILVPLLAMAALVGLGGNNNDERVSAAVVNLDEAVELDGQLVPLGRQLAGAILERDGDNIGWTLADAKNAKDGLRSGEFSAVVTIPPEFSAAATSFSENDADVARQATVGVQVSDNAPVTDAAVAQEIARLAADTINSQLTESYLDNIYVGFNQVADQFVTIVDGSKQLADGAADLSDGTGEASEGAVQLSDGLNTLSDNSSELVGGGEQLQDGAAQLADGANQLTDGANGLASGASELSSGVSALATGSSALASGASELATGASALKSGASGLADGASDLSVGLSEFSEQTPKLVDGVDQLATGAKPLLGAIPGYTSGTTQVVGGVSELKGGIDQIIAGLDGAPAPDGGSDAGTAFDPLIKGAQGVATGAKQVDQGASAVAEGIVGANNQLRAFSSGKATLPKEAVNAREKVKAAFKCPVEDPEVCGLLKASFVAGVDGGFTAGFRTGTGTGSAALTTKDPRLKVSLLDVAGSLKKGTGELATGSSKLSTAVEGLPAEIQEGTKEQLGALYSGLQKLSEGAGTLVTQAKPLVDNAPQLSSGATQLLGGIDELNTQVAPLPGGVAQLSEGASQLSSGASQLSGGVSQLSGGASDLSGGASQLDGGVSQLAGGASQLSSGASQLAGGVSQLGSGASDLSRGVSQYVGGIRQYTAGVDSAAEGARKFSDGIVQLDDGAEQLAEGTNTFATELAKGADEVPTYSSEAREKLSTVVSNPVAQSDDLVDSSRAALVALLMVSVLWVASVATFVVSRPVPSNVLTSNASNATLWGRTLAMPVLITAAQGLLFALMGGVVLELPAGRLFGLMGLLAVLGAVFALINHALTAWLGNVGRGISLLLLAISVVLGLTSATPGVFDAVASVSPVHNGLLMVRTWVAQGDGMAGYVGGMLLVAAIAGILSVAAIASRRKLTAGQFRSRVASSRA